MKTRSITAAVVAVALAAALAPPVQGALPFFMEKPPTWTSMLATNAGPFVKDSDFAQWVKNAQGNPARFSFLAGFHTCYGGGFLTELRRKGVVKFGANSASRYFEPAYYDPNNPRSYFTFAWGQRALNPAGDTDLDITDGAWTRLTDGINPPAVPPVPDNPNSPWQNAQYLSDPNNNPPPEKLKAAQHNYAILWSGNPDGRDLNDINHIYNVLVATGYARGDIYVLYGAGGMVAGAPWSPADAPATAVSLQNAFAVWLNGKLNAQMPNRTAQVFFWAGDHGAADFPILISADHASVGVAGSAVAARRAAGQPVGNLAYEAGGGTNRGIWEILGGGDVDAIAFTEMSVPMSFDSRKGGWVYFSVDRTSPGAVGSDVARERARGRSAATDVFAMTQNGNRQTFDGQDSLGLAEPMMGNDELDALSLRNIQSVLDQVTKLSNRPLFFSFLNSSRVYVCEPNANCYLYYDFLRNFANAPWELDALSLWDDGARDPMTNLLYFNPFSDRMLFSVGRQENAFPWNAVAACDILKLGPNMMGGGVLARWRTCAQLGLVAGPDNLDALDLGIGTNGQPVDSYYPYPYPSPYPEPSYPPYPGSPAPMPPPSEMGAEPEPGPEPVVDLSDPEAEPVPEEETEIPPF